MAIFVTSDSHFNHTNILAYCPESRPFKTVEEMNEVLIERWNSVVKPEDTVIHCGDLCMGQRTKIDEIIPRLNGRIILVRGNHDNADRVAKYKEYGIEIKDIHYYAYKGCFFIFCHFPIMNEEFGRMVREDNSEVIWIYGHVHEKAPQGLVDGGFHAGVDTNNLTPVSLDYIWSLSKEEQIKKNIPDQAPEELVND